MDSNENMEESEWELSKENVQPLRQGRKFANLTAALQPSTDEQAVKLKEQRQLFESELRAYEGDDPLDVWYRYIEWIEQNFPRGGNDCNIQHLLQSCVTAFKDRQQYKNDPRFLDVCIKLAGSCPSAVELYDFLYNQSIGCELARLYTAWADALEAVDNTTKADSVYKCGLQRGAVPRDLLTRKHAELQARVARELAMKMQTGGDPVTEEVEAVPRTTLGVLKGKGARAKVGVDRTTNSRRQQGGVQLSSSSVPGNSQKMSFSVYTDENASAPCRLPPQNEQWQHVPDSETVSENMDKPTVWTDARVKNRYMSAVNQQGSQVTSQPFVIHRDEELDQPMVTPHKVLGTSEVLSARKAPRAADPLQHIQQSCSGAQRKEIVMYDKEKVYAGISEFSLEEIRAAYRHAHQGVIQNNGAPPACGMPNNYASQMAKNSHSGIYQTTYGSSGLSEVAMYTKDKVYASHGVFSFEELRADHQLTKLRCHKEAMELEEKRQMLLRQQAQLQEEQDRFLQMHKQISEEMHQQRAQLKEQMEMMVVNAQHKIQQLTPLAQVLPQEERSDMRREMPRRDDEDADVSMSEDAIADHSAQRSSSSSSSFTSGQQQQQQQQQQLHLPMVSPLMTIGQLEITPLCTPSNDDDVSKKTTAPSTTPMSKQNFAMSHAPMVAPSPTLNTREAMQVLMGIYNEPLDSSEYTLQHAQFFLPKDAPAKQPTSVPFKVFEDVSPKIASSKETCDISDKENGFSAFTDVRTKGGQRAMAGLLSRLTSQGDVVEEGEENMDVGESIPQHPFDEEEEAHLPEITFAPTSSSTHNFTALSRLCASRGTTFDLIRAEDETTAPDSVVADSNNAPGVSECLSKYQQYDLSPIMEASEPSSDSSNGRSNASQPSRTPGPSGDMSEYYVDRRVSHVQRTTPTDADHRTPGPPSDMSEYYADRCMTQNQQTTPAGDDASPRPLATAADVSAYYDGNASVLGGGLECSVLIDPDDPFDDRLIAQFLSRLHVPLEERPNYHGRRNGYMPAIMVGVVNPLGTEMYNVEKVLGKGAYGKVYESTLYDEYMIESSERKVIKVQQPACPWEFYITSELHQRLSDNIAGGKDVRPSIMSVDHGYFFIDGSCLVSELHERGTILDMVNSWSKRNKHEFVLMYFTIELLHIMERMHACQIIHGDLKPDNFLVVDLLSACDAGGPQELINSRTTRVFKLIDFGRSIDMTMFPAGTTFMTKVDTCGFRCNEMKSDRPWTYQTDLFGFIVIVHVLCFGEYMKTFYEGGHWRATQVWKRQWMFAHLWQQLCDDMLNIPSCEQLPNLAKHRRLFEEAFVSKVNWRNFCEELQSLDSVLGKK